MYTSYIMRRTQIYLSDDQGRLLESRSRTTGQSISELIRFAIEAVYATPRPLTRAQKVALAKRTSGAWKDFPETGAEFVERLRGSQRLGRLHRAGVTR